MLDIPVMTGDSMDEMSFCTKRQPEYIGCLATAEFDDNEVAMQMTKHVSNVPG
jgi:hypothetical protein